MTNLTGFDVQTCAEQYIMQLVNQTREYLIMCIKKAFLKFYYSNIHVATFPLAQALQGFNMKESVVQATHRNTVKQKPSNNHLNGHITDLHASYK